MARISVAYNSVSGVVYGFGAGDADLEGTYPVAQYANAAYWRGQEFPPYRNDRIPTSNGFFKQGRILLLDKLPASEVVAVVFEPKAVITAPPENPAAGDAYVTDIGATGSFEWQGTTIALEPLQKIILSTPPTVERLVTNSTFALKGTPYSYRVGATRLIAFGGNLFYPKAAISSGPTVPESVPDRVGAQPDTLSFRLYDRRISSLPNRYKDLTVPFSVFNQAGGSGWNAWLDTAYPVAIWQDVTFPDSAVMRIHLHYFVTPQGSVSIDFIDSHSNANNTYGAVGNIRVTYAKKVASNIVTIPAGTKISNIKIIDAYGRLGEYRPSAAIDIEATTINTGLDMSTADELKIITQHSTTGSYAGSRTVNPLYATHTLDLKQLRENANGYGWLPLESGYLQVRVTNFANGTLALEDQSQGAQFIAASIWGNVKCLAGEI